MIKSQVMTTQSFVVMTCTVIIWCYIASNWNAFMLKYYLPFTLGNDDTTILRMTEKTNNMPEKTSL